MTVPFVRVDQVDGALALLPADTDQITCVVGSSTLAPPNTLLAFRSLAKLRTIAGYGPGVEACADQLAQNGVAYLCSPTTDVAGVAGTPVETGTSPAIGSTGTPNDDYRIVVTITKAGVLGTSQCTISLDGGNTVPAAIATAATIVLANTGVTITMAAGTYNVGDACTIVCQAPYFSPTNFAAAGAAILADPGKREFGTMLVAGKAHGADAASQSTAAVAMCVAGGTFRALAQTTYGRYFRVVVEAPDVTAAAVVTALVSTVDAGALLCASPMDVQSPISQLVHKRPGGGIYCARIGSITPQKHPGEVRQGKGNGGPLPSRVRAIYFNDDDIATLDAARCITVRTIVNKTGFYFTNGPTLDAVGADESEHQFCRVMDLASKITRDALNEWLNSDLAIKRDGTGRLTDVQADVIDADITAKLRAATVDTGYVVDAVGKVDRTINVLGTSSLEGDTGVLRKGYAKFISWRVGFTKGS